jgi:hypothetical protein
MHATLGWAYKNYNNCGLAGVGDTMFNKEQLEFIAVY